MIPSSLDQVEHLGFALYGFEPSVCLVSKLYQWAVDWFTRLGYSPDKACANIGGKSDGMYKSFRNLDRKLRNLDFDGVISWELLAIPNELANEKFGQLHGEAMAIAYDTRSLNRYLVFHIREAIIYDRKEEFLEAARQACKLLCPRYGIGYRRKFKFGPTAYGIGFIHNNTVDPTDYNMDYWRLLNRHEVYTFLRDIYPWNFLTSTQLNVKVGRTLLRDWIESKSNRGILTPFTDHVTLWTVPYEAIFSIREALLKVGVVLDRKRDFEDKIDEYHVDEDVVAEHYKTGTPLVHQPRGPGISEEEMLQNIMGAFGGPDSQVFRKEESGELREIKPETGNNKKKS